MILDSADDDYTHDNVCWSHRLVAMSKAGRASSLSLQAKPYASGAAMPLCSFSAPLSVHIWCKYETRLYGPLPVFTFEWQHFRQNYFTCGK